MTGPLRFGLLGPLQVVDDGHDLTPNAARLKTVLALLLTRPGKVVSLATFYEELWGSRLPATSKNSLQVFIRELRRILAPGLGARDVGQPLQQVGDGYVLRVSPAHLDTGRFENLVSQGRQALPHDPAAASRRLTRALSLWRGNALCDVPTGPCLELQVRALEEARLTVIEQRVEADLSFGDHEKLVPELHILTADHPLREAFWRQLMLVLYRCGRQAESLEAYGRLRSTLVDELGIEPGEAVVELHHAILRNDSTLAKARTSAVIATRPPQREPINQLPPDIADFVGRTGFLATVERSLTAAEAGSGSSAMVPTVAISGRAGIGKTSLAVRSAYRVREHYEDGQLYVNLRGATATPRSAGEVLGEFLRALGTDGSQIPESVDERSSMFRTRLSDRGVLILLDDAADEAQVRPLLPNSSTCAVLITSRRRLASIEGMATVELPNFETAEATALLEHIAGRRRVAHERPEAERITELCGHLPLAVRVAGGKLAQKPHWTLAGLAGRLADERSRLRQLSTGDLDVNASIELSYQACGDEQRRILRMMGLFSVAELPAWPIAAAARTPQETVEATLEELIDWQLVHAANDPHTGEVRYQLHDLVRVFATDRLLQEHPPAERNAAMTRALNAYRSLARHADGGFQPGRWQPPLSRQDSAGAEYVSAATRSRAVSNPVGWFSAERPGLLFAIEHAHAVRDWTSVWTLVHAVHGFFDLHFRWDDWEPVIRLGIDAARRLHSPLAQAWMKKALGDYYVDAGLIEEALVQLREAEETCRGLDERGHAGHMRLDIAACLLTMGHIDQAMTHLNGLAEMFGSRGDHRGEAFAYSRLGVVCRYKGRITEAETCNGTSLRLWRRLGDRRWEAEELRRLASIRALSGRHGEAFDALSSCLSILRSLHDARGESMALRALGQVFIMQNRFPEAEDCLVTAKKIMFDIGDRRNEAYMSQCLGDFHRRTGHYEAARVLLEESLSVFVEFADDRGRALSLLSLGNLDREEKRFPEAESRINDALTLARRLPVRLWEAQALRDLGRVHADTGEPVRARDLWATASRIFHEIGSPEEAEVHRLLEDGFAARSD